MGEPCRREQCGTLRCKVNCNSARVDIGGKLLTNYLKELVSYRQWNMMDDTMIVSKVWKT